MKTLAYFVFNFLILGSSFALASPTGKNPYFVFHGPNGTEIRVDLNDNGPPPATLAEAKEAVEFFFHRDGRANGAKIRPGSRDNLQDYAVGAPLFVLCHGFTSNNRDFGGSFLGAFRELSNREGVPLNVIVINWEKLAAAPWYVTASHNVGPVGTETACLLKHLIREKYTSLELIHFIGHSLGSHVGNHVGNMVNSKCGKGQKIGRITALDPALPFFHDADERRRIDPEDAEFVDVIHSAKNLLGFAEPRGHVDFYVNMPNDGASPQPGCNEPSYSNLPPMASLILNIVSFVKEHICSHSRATSYFVESIRNPNAFFGCMCKDWKEFAYGSCACVQEVRMGLGTPNSTDRGSYFLKTNDKSPYGRGSNNGLKTNDIFHLKRTDHKRTRLGILSI